MNRAQRRATGTVTKEPTYCVTKSQLDSMIHDAYKNGYDAGTNFNIKEGVNRAVLMLFGIPLRILYEQYNWGKAKRLPEFANWICKYYDDFSDGDMSLTEYEQFVLETVGMKFTQKEVNE